jgi:hypothetical protein
MDGDCLTTEQSKAEELTQETVLKDLDLTERAIAKAKIIAPRKSYAYRIAEDFMTMATSYFKDAKHFYEHGKYVNAFACVNYAHGWLDAGARLGVFDVDEDSRLFTLAE